MFSEILHLSVTHERPVGRVEIESRNLGCKWIGKDEVPKMEVNTFLAKSGFWVMNGLQYENSHNRRFVSSCQKKNLTEVWAIQNC